MSSEQHFESLYRILVGAEDLLSGSREDSQASQPVTYEERVAAMNERGWDVQDDTASQVESVSGREQPLSEQITPTDESPSPVEAPAATAPPAPASPVAAREELTQEERRRRLETIADQIRSCRTCPLSMGRTNAVPGEGALDPMVMIVGEGPGYHEDQQGRPFVGNAGTYLDKWLEAIGITREESAFIANIVKCRPPNNRDPKPEESEVCSPYLRQQISLVRPRLILTVGRISTRILTGSTQGITRIHGTFFRYEGIPLVPTFHPSAVLRKPEYRRPVWEDLKKVRSWLIDNAGHRPQDTTE